MVAGRNRPSTHKENSYGIHRIQRHHDGRIGHDTNGGSVGFRRWAHYRLGYRLLPDRTRRERATASENAAMGCQSLDRSHCRVEFCKSSRARAANGYRSCARSAASANLRHHNLTLIQKGTSCQTQNSNPNCRPPKTCWTFCKSSATLMPTRLFKWAAS